MGLITGSFLPTSLEQRGLERAVERARFAGAAVVFLIGPLFPNVGLAAVLALGVALLAYGTVLRLLQRRARTIQQERRVGWLAFWADASVISYAMFVFSPDPKWTTFILGVLIILIGTFRFGGTGAIASALAMSLAYVAVAVFRERAFDLVFEPERVAFHVAFFLLTALLVSGILRELHALRGEREDMHRRASEAEASERAAERVRSVLDSALDGVIGMNSTGAITEWNAQAETMFGWSRSEALGRILADTIVPERYRGSHREGLATYLETGIGPVLRKRIEVEALRRDGSEFPVELSIVPVETPAGIAFTAFLRDLTERRSAEAAVLRQIALEEAARARRTLLMRASHELRTPLNAVLGFTDLLREQLAGTVTAKQELYMRNIAEAGGRLLELVDGLLELSRLETGRADLERRTITIDELLAPIVAQVKRAASARGLRFEMGAAPEGSVDVDAPRIQQALVELLSSAVRSTPPGGRVGLDARLDGPALLVTVTDEAAATSSAQSGRLFDALEPRAEGEQGGDFGLAIVRAIVELHGGDIAVTSRSEGGTAFRVRIPQAAARTGPGISVTHT